MKDKMAEHALWSPNSLIRWTICFVAALGISILFSFGRASGGEVQIRKIGDRLPLYESASIYYLRIAEDLPKAGDGRIPDVDEWADGIQHQAALHAFMFFIDMTRARPAGDDKYSRALISATHRLMEKVDWAEFEKYVRFIGFEHADGFFIGYKKEMLEEDLTKFRESVRTPAKKERDETSAPGNSRSAPGRPLHGKETPEPSTPSGGSAPLQSPEGQPRAEPGTAPK